MEQVGPVEHVPNIGANLFPPKEERENENAPNFGNKRRAASSAEERIKELSAKKRRQEEFCLQSDHSSSSRSNEIFANENDSQCVCGIGWAGDQSFMIQCDSCSNWYHGKCVGVKSYQVPHFWTCKICGNKTSNEDELVDIEGSNSDSDDGIASFSEVAELPSAEDYNTKPSRRISWNQYAIAAYKILQREKRPMSYKELTEMAIKEKLIVTSSSTPTCSMSSALSTHANKGIRFKRISSGVYSLLEWDDNPDISVKILGYTHHRKRGRKPNSMKMNKVMDETQKLVKENLSDSDGTNDSCSGSSNLTYKSKAEVGHVEETLQISVNIKHEERDKSHIEERSLPLIKRLNFRFQQ